MHVDCFFPALIHVFVLSFARVALISWSEGKEVDLRLLKVRFLELFVGLLNLSISNFVASVPKHFKDSLANSEKHTLIAHLTQHLFSI